MMHRRQFIGGSLALSLPASVTGSLAQSAAPVAEASEHRLAKYTQDMTFERLPPEVVAAVKRLLIDTLACAFGAVGAEPARIADETFRAAYGGPAVATVIGQKGLSSVEGATLVNGVLVRYLDLNDIYAGGDPAHPSECIPAAIACCEDAGRSGRDLITAIAIGYETQLALVDAVGFSSRSFHSVSCAGFVTPLIAGKAWGMTPAQMAHGMGISGPKQMTLLAINSGPISMVKALVYPQGAADGVFSARMARNGFTGAAGVLEWFVQRTKGRTSEFVLDLRPDRFRILTVGLKRFPLQFELQTIAEAGVELHAGLKGRLVGVKEILVETSERAKEATASPSRYEPKTKETADHSLPICLALALIEGDVTVEHFEHDRWKGADVFALARKIRVEVSPSSIGVPRGSAESFVKVTLASGESFEKRIALPDGDPRRPMSEAALTAKFMQFAEPVLGKARAVQLLETCHRVETFRDVHELTQLLVPV